MKEEKTNETVVTQKRIWMLKPEYSLGGYDTAAVMDDNTIVFTTTSGVLVARNGYNFSSFILEDGQTATRDISDEWIFDTEEEAKRVCKHANERTFSYLAKRVIDLESKMKKVESYLQSFRT